MGFRVPLEKDTKLRFTVYNQDTAYAKNTVTYTIQNEIDRGGSSIVYNACFINNAGLSKTVRIKECYPYHLKIAREESGRLAANGKDEVHFEEYKERVREAFEISSELFSTKGLTNSISNPIDFYEANNTFYIVSSYLEGEKLSPDMFASLREAISVVKSTAAAVKKIHDRGYLYLDVKPENIFVLNGTTELVQLFDFDSLIPLDRKEEFCNYRISYTKGFSAFEQRLGELKNIGKYTDVFGIGALLYYLIFGKTITVLECDKEAIYDYSVSKYAAFSYRDKLFYALTDFFHHTLPVFYPDRYQDLQEVIWQLSEIEKYADLSKPFICDTPVFVQNHMIGREREIHLLEQWMFQSDRKCIFITGLGGIGKSTLVRSCLAKNKSLFDTVLYLYYNQSVQSMITDDEQLCVNTLEKTEEETTSDYFHRKLIYLRKITTGTKTIVVIDNFDGMIEEDFLSILNIGWKVIVITRTEINLKEYDTIKVQAIHDKEDLYRLFTGNLGREIAEEEIVALDSVIHKVSGHTLTLELIAKQMARSYLTMEEAAGLAEKHGFSHIASEKVDYVKDGRSYYEKISNIISALFSAERMAFSKRSILKTVSFFHMPGVDIHILEKLMELDSKDEIHELKSEGWLMIENQKVFLHPVVSETIHQWEWSHEYIDAAICVMENMDKEIQSQSGNGFHPYLRLSEDILENCKSDLILQKAEQYKRLLYRTVMKMPRDREDYIISRSEEIFTDSLHIHLEEIIKLYDYVVFLLCEKGEFDAVYDKIIQAEEILRKHPDAYLWGIYYDMCSDYYDSLLNGSYCAESKQEKAVLNALLDSIDCAVRYMKKAENPDSKLYLVKYMLSKASILIRSFPKEKSKIKNLIRAAKAASNEYMVQDLEIRDFYCMTCAWYYTLCEPCYHKTTEFIQRAYKIMKNRQLTELDKIDDILVPGANMMVEWERYGKAAAWLKAAIKVCNRHEDSLPYIRKKKELYDHLLEVYELRGDVLQKL